MAGRDIVVIGGSAGAIPALVELVRRLPADLAATLFVVLHMSPKSPGVLPGAKHRRSRIMNPTDKLSREELLEELDRLRTQCQQLRAQQFDREVYEAEFRAQHEELLQAQQLLQASRDRYRDLYEFAPIAYVTLDAQGLVKEINMTGARLLEVERGPLLERPFRLSFAEDARRGFLEHMRRCRQETEPITSELRLRLRSGKEVPVELISRRIRSGQEPNILFRTTITDLTERKKTEEELRALNQELERRTAEAEYVAKEVRRLASEMTHVEQSERQRLARMLHDHLQQWLIAAKLHLAALKRHERSEAAEAQLQKTEELLDSCLNASRSLTVELSPPVLEDRGLCAALQWLVHWMEEQYQLEVELELEERIEPPPGPLRILLFEGVRELLLNVVKHAGVDRAAIELRRSDSSTLELCVRDWGAGFDVQRIGETRDHGSSFGLSHLQHRLELLGGKLEIESSIGEGTCGRLHVSLEPSAKSLSSSSQLTSATGASPPRPDPPAPSCRWPSHGARSDG